METEEKTRDQLLNEVEGIRKELAYLKALESGRKWIEAALRESEERYRRLVESITEYIYTVRVENGSPISASHGPGCLAVTGYTSEYFQIYPHLWYEMIHEDDRGEVLTQIEKVLSGAAVQPIEHRIIHKDGSIRWIRNTIVPHYDREGELIAYDGMIENITERKMVEEALKYERDKLIRVFEAMEDGVYIVNQQYDIEYINPVLERAFGPWKGIKCYTCFHDRTEVCPWCPNQKVFAGETVRWEWTSSKSGKTFDLIDTPLRQPDGSIWKLEIFRDITEKKRAEEKILKLSQAIEQSPVSVFITDAEGDIEYVNTRFTEMTGSSREDVTGRKPDILASGAGAISDMGWCGEFLARKKSGETYWEYSTISPVVNDRGDIANFIGISEDITARKKTEETLKQHLDDLTRFEKATIQREFRMRDLKEENKRLKEKIEELEKGKE